MALILEPHAPLHIITVSALSLAMAAMTWNYFKYRWKNLGGKSSTRKTVFFLSLLAAALLAGSALNPVWKEKREENNNHIVVVMDVSESIKRARGGWKAVHKTACQWIKAAVSKQPSGGKASIVIFREKAALWKSVLPLEELPKAFRELTERDVAAGRGSCLEKGLLKAEEAIDTTGGQGAIWMITDGNQTTGDALKPARSLGRRGIPVYILPAESGEPPLSITDADLPRHVDENAETFLRGVIHNGTCDTVQATFTLQQNPGIDGDQGRFGWAGHIKRAVRIKTEAKGKLRSPLSFKGCGLQFVDLSLTSDKSKAVQHRRFFTHVSRPVRILAIGGNHSWTHVFSPNTAAVTPVGPTDITGDTDLSHYDVAVLGSVPAHQFSGEALKNIATSVTRGEVGLFLINGGHKGASKEAKTVLMSYENTPIAPLLPVSSKPRPFQAEPPPRQVVILIDTSGSMKGWRLYKSQAIAANIIKHHLRSQDRLDLITFSGNASHLVQNQYMTARGKADALRKLNSIQASGGTDPREALDLIASRQMNHCGLIFISDGEFQKVNYRPDCRATVFAIGHDYVPANSSLWAFSDPFPVNSSFSPARIRIPYFNPKPRDKFFEFGTFTPLSMNNNLTRKERLEVPSLPLKGSAISYLKPEGKMIAIRPKLLDPVLSFMDKGEASTGVFSSAIDGDWLRHPEGKRAVEEWILRVVPYTARNRYDFQVTDTGETMEIKISLIPGERGIPRIDRIKALIKTDKNAPMGLSLKPDPNTPGVFKGTIRISRASSTTKAMLILRESGRDALPRAQQIPMLVPPAAPVDTRLPAESYSSGMNRPLLQAMARESGGAFNPEPKRLPSGQLNNSENGTPLWPYLAALALFAHLIAVALQRWNP